MIEELKSFPSKVNLELFDVIAFSKDKIREMFRAGKMPTSDAMVEEILLRAVKEGATDIHIEPAETELRLRLGYEGILKRLVTLPKEITDSISNVLKQRANLNAFEKKKPQEGRFSMNYGALQYDMRVSTVPTLFGERIAVRILHKTTRVASIQEIGLSNENLERIRKILRRPIGLLLVTGPAGSGKTTTVYAAVNEIQSPEKNVMTVENPVEYKLDFASQVQTPADKSFSFADALRSILRQNPNVIMLGEIRDAETGIVAAEAALTGNLVLSTMLSTDAIGTIPRLFNLGIPSFWLGSTLTGVVYQQLIRRICESCKEEYQPDADELALLGKIELENPKFFRGKGCSQCQQTGYKGRIAIHEVVTVDDVLKDLIYQQATYLKLKEAALAAGLEPIRIDALKRVISGITTIAEYSRSVG